MDQDVPPQAADDGGLTEGLEGLPANRPCVYDAKLRTLQTLRHATPAAAMTEGLEGSRVNRPHAREAKLRTLQTLRQQQADLGCEGRDQR